MRAAVTLAMVLCLGLAACASVLGLHRTSAAHLFEHRAHIVRGINCLECHRGMAGAKDAGPLHLPGTADCVRCHSKPHDEHPCEGCHGESYVRGGVELARARLRFEHPGHLRAVRGDCVRCHVEVTEAAPQAILPKMATCFGCHEHRDQWTLRDCDGCHVEVASELATRGPCRS